MAKQVINLDELAEKPGVIDLHALAGPQQPLGFGERMSKGFGDVGRGIIAGGKSTLTGLAQLPRAIVGAPRQVGADIAALVTNPSEAIPAQFERAKQFAWGAVPFSRSISDVAAGKPLTLQGLAEQGTELGLSIRAPQAVAKAVPAAAKAITKRLPGASVELNEIALGKLRQLPEAYRPGAQAANQAYAAAEAMGNPTISMEPMRQAAQRLLAKELSLSSPDKSFISLLKNSLKTSDGGWSFNKAHAEIVDWGEKIGHIAASKGTRLGEMRELLGSIHESLADARPIKVVDIGRPETRTQSRLPPIYATQAPTELTLAQQATWKEAQRLARRNFAANELKEMVESGIVTTGDQVHQINANKIITNIERKIELAPQNKRAKLFTESFQPGELREIIGTLKEIGSKAPRVPPGAGVNVGSFRRVRQVAAGGLAGGAVGALAAPIAADLMSSALMTGPGRNLVRWSITPTQGMSMETAQILGGYLRAQNESE